MVGIGLQYARMYTKQIRAENHIKSYTTRRDINVQSNQEQNKSSMCNFNELYNV